MNAKSSPKTITSTNSDKAAIVRTEPTHFSVCFGWVRGDEFVVRHFNSSRTFKTEKGATKAAQGWFDEKTWGDE